MREAPRAFPLIDGIPRESPPRPIDPDELPNNTNRRLRSSHRITTASLQGAHNSDRHSLVRYLKEERHHERVRINRPRRDRGRSSIEHSVRAAGRWKISQRRRCAAGSLAHASTRTGDLDVRGWAGTLAKGTATAVEQKKGLDRCRCARVLGDRAFSRSRHVLVGNGHIAHVDNRAIRAGEWLRWRYRIRQRRIQRSVWTRRRRSIRHGRQPVHVRLHNDDISRSERDRRRDVLHVIPKGNKLDLS
jgi:hypothetical protein